MVTEIKENKFFKIIFSILSWFFSIIFIIMGMGFLIDFIISGILTIIAGLIILPPFNKFLKNKYDIKLKIGLKILIVLILLILAGIFTYTSIDNSVNKQQLQEEIGNNIQKVLITKSTDDMLPSPSELPTEYSMGEKEEITKESNVITSRNAQEGFDSGKQLYISKYKDGTYTVTDYIEITFGIYKFDNSDYASDFQNNVVQSVVNDGGYEKVSVSADAECFAWKEDYGYSAGKVGSNICYHKNVVYWIDVTISNSFKNPDKYLKEMTKIVDGKVR